MRSLSVLKCTPVLAALLCGTTASADVTAQEVWDSWSKQMEIYGEGLTTGAVTMSGDTLTVEDLRIEMSDDEFNFIAEVGDMAFTENGDGTVSITISNSYPLTWELTPEFDDPTTLNVTVAQSGMNIVASGDPETVIYDITADLYSMTLDSIEGADAEELDLEIAALIMRDMAGRYAVTEGELNTFDYTINLGALDFDLKMSEPDGDGQVEFAADVADLAMTAVGAIPADMDLDADMPPFADGLAFQGGYSFGDLRYVFDVAVDDVMSSGTAVVGSGEVTVDANFDGVSFAGAANDLDFSMNLPQEFPFPIEATAAGYGFAFDVPLSQGDGGPRDARIAFDYTNLSISDSIWNLFDPAQILPRDPVTIALGLDMKVTPFFDFLDPEQQDALMMTDVPGELNAAEITELTIRGGGAEITGNGAFTFDNSDLDTFDGFPRPQGEANFAINGVNGLIDNLIEMGLIPQDEAMMPRMMLGMFSTPVGDDMLTSTIGVNADGHVLANGQRLR